MKGTTWSMRRPTKWKFDQRFCWMWRRLRAEMLLPGAASHADSCWSSWTGTRRQSGGRTSRPIGRSQTCGTTCRAEMTECGGWKHVDSCKMKYRAKAAWPFSTPTCRLGYGRRSRSRGEPLAPPRPELWCSPPSWMTAQSYPRRHCRHTDSL